LVSQEPTEHIAEGLYENVISQALEDDLRRAQAAGFRVDREPIGVVEGARTLSTYFQRILEERLASLKEPDRVDAVNRLIAELGAPQVDSAPSDMVTGDPKPLLTLVSSSRGGLTTWQPQRPEIPLGTSDLLMNNRHGPTMLRSLTSEMASADDISVIVSFIMWPGVRLMLSSLREAIDRGARVRVLTTTYMGVTQPRALDALECLGAEVRVNFDTQGTRLHAKGWLFERRSGLSTAYIGSSNMSHAAMSVGQEWNVRMSAVETPHLLHKFRAVFTSFWDNPGNGFEPYEPRTRPADRDRLLQAIDMARGGATQAPLNVDDILPYDIEPLPFQQEMLEDLDRERDVFGRYRNLVVAATGTGKTLLAAFDYRRLARQGTGNAPERRPRLLYVAHRAEILRQARRAFRHVLRDPNFGELLVDGETPNSNEFVFASIQSLHEQRLAGLQADYYDYVVIDEFHHAGAPTWTRLLEVIRPRILLGLTATPERADGIDILQWFGGHTATEIRLWEALERSLLVPFHYFGIGDESLDFRGVTWSGGRYSVGELEDILTGDDAFMHRVVNEITEKVSDSRSMRALVFCVSIAHARYVAHFLGSRGLQAQALTSEEGSPERQDAVRRLRAGELQALVTVDLFNEGVDIPEVDTVVLLRPTESQTVFLQQLGRGLRHSPNKDVLTVLDFVGHQNRKFRYDRRFQSLTGTPRSRLEDAVEAGFPFLPSGCSIQLDKIASSVVLDNIRANVPNRVSDLVREIREYLPNESPLGGSLHRFLEATGRELSDIYGNREHSWTSLLRRSGRPMGKSGVHEEHLLKRVSAIIHVDDLPRIRAYRDLITGDLSGLADPTQQLFATMFHHSLWSTAKQEWRGRGLDRLAEGLDLLRRERAVVEEMLQVLDEAQARIKHVTFPLAGDLAHLPTRVHARYSRAEMLAGVGWADVDTGVAGQAAGVRYVSSIRADVFDVTWQKSERDYSPNTMYRDYAISPTLLSWESQNAAHQESRAIQRYVRHRETGTHILIFARESKGWEFAGPRPWLFLGTAHYVSHFGERPVTFRWELDRALPADFFTASEVLAG